MTYTPPSRLMLHAPNVHGGGGLTLLKTLLLNAPQSLYLCHIDGRAEDRLTLPAGVARLVVRRTVASRLAAEWRLRRLTNKDDMVLCFHGLPPLFPIRGRAAVFVQNRLLLNDSSLAGFPLTVRMRIRIERFWLRSRCRAAHYFVVQTPSMRDALKATLGESIPVILCPFMPPYNTMIEKKSASPKRFDFVYVASGDAHKNHAMLLAAWKLLATENGCPTLAVTIDSVAYPALAATITQSGLPITNLGPLDAAEIHHLYQSASALIFPSYSESFGLPLLEAARHGLPIIAAELDFVRDVVVPEQSFNPHSARSIADAVRRFLGRPSPSVTIQSAEGFWQRILS